jgi:alpha-tubulin suppressor-like RCC1 family protein
MKTWFVAVFLLAGTSINSLAQCCPPFFTTQPQSTNSFQGTPVTFWAAANGGSSAVTYQWRFNGVDIPGATATNYIIPSVQYSNAGVYTVWGTNAVGGILSSNAALTVYGPPAITNQPSNVTKTETGTATFTVGATGTTPLSYQWRFANNNLAGATSSSLTLNNVQAWQAGSYSVLVANTYGAITSSTAVLTVTFPVGTVACWGDNASNKATLPIGLSAGYQAVAAGGNHSLALKTNAIVVGWGDNTFGQTSVPSLIDVTAIAAGYNHSLALRSNGTVVAWGDNTYGQTNVPPGLSNVVSISAGAYHNLALQNDGTVVAWGYDADGETDVPPGLNNVVQIAAGYYHNLALLKNGGVVGWGLNGHNECNIPGSVTTPVARLSCGYGFSLALLTNGSIAAWGDNSFNQTNISPNINTNVVAISAGGYHSLALKTNGTVVGWGQNTYGETSIPFVISKMVAISAGTYHSMSLEGSGAPYVTVQPASQRVALGNNAGFFVMAAGTTSALKYQWQFNGANIASATNSTYTRLNAQLADAGSYTVVLSNVVGMVTSSAATLNVDSTSVTLTALGFTNSGFQLRLSGPSGIYTIDASSDLSFWEPISTNTMLVNPIVITDPAAFFYPYRLYRARQ